MTNNAVLLIDGHHGIYIPKIFAEDVIAGNYKVKNKKDAIILESLSELGNPENEFYWEAWADLIGNIILIGLGGQEYYLHQEDDLWAVPVGESFDDE